MIQARCTRDDAARNIGLSWGGVEGCHNIYTDDTDSIQAVLALMDTANQVESLRDRVDNIQSEYEVLRSRLNAALGFVDELEKLRAS